MISTLTVNERQTALLLCLAVALTGLVMTVAGRHDPLGVHGFIVLLAGLACAFVVLRSYYAPAPGPERLSAYYDEPIKVGIVASLISAVIAMCVGDWVA